MASDVRENHYERGASLARRGFPKDSREEFRSNGFDRDLYRWYAKGYDEAFETMTPEQRKAAALNGP